MGTSSELTIRGFRVRAVDVPMARPLATGGGMVSTAPLVLLDLLTDQGILGRAYVFCYTTLALAPVAQLLKNLESVLVGDIVAPAVIDQKLQRRFRLLGPQGLTGIAMAAIDMAAWDALARSADMPLVCLLGGQPRAIPAYNSCGLGLIGPARAAEEARALVAPGFRAIKVRLGYPDVATDVAVIRAVRRAVGDDVHVMTDYNQSLSIPEALRRARVLDDEDVYWIEEPTSADDVIGHARISNEVHAPVQIGENWWGTHDMAKSLAGGASDLVMPDVMKIGGVTGWLRAAALAEAAGTPMSCHLFPEISSHLLAVTPTAHWLEYVDWVTPLLTDPPRFEDGGVRPTNAPGSGIDWNEPAVERYLVG